MSKIFNLIILDESGSMEPIREQALVGANKTIQSIRVAQQESPDDNQMITFVTFDSTGIHPAIANPLPKAAQLVVQATAVREEMFMEAAAEWDESKLTAALCQDPLVQDFTRVRDVAADIMRYNARFVGKAQ